MLEKPQADWVARHVHRKTVYKSYVCDFSSTILSNLLTPQRGYWIECNTTQVRPCSSSHPAQWRIFPLTYVSHILRFSLRSRC